VIRKPYFTKALLRVFGRGGSVGIDLGDAGLPGSAPDKHMTVLYREDKPWSVEELSEIQKATSNWIRRHDGDDVSFWIEDVKPGRKSADINGDLWLLWNQLTREFASMVDAKDQERSPHVEILMQPR